MATRLSLTTLFLGFVLCSVFAADHACAARTRSENRKRNSGQDRIERIWRLDRNGDSRISHEEYERWRNSRKRPELFDQIDVNSDGFLDSEELKAFAGSMSNKAEQRRSRPRGKSQDFKDIQSNLNIQYAKIPGVDPNLLSLDIYALDEIEQSGRSPVVVMIHGGGWRGGDKANAAITRYKVPHFTGAHYLYVSVNYRLSPAVRHPAHVQDVATALAWIHNHISEYRGDPNRLFVMGHSAGAHLASLVATDERYLQELNKDLRIIKGVVALDNGGYDIVRLMNDFGNPALYVNAFGNDESGWRDASPVTHIDAGKKIPPFLILYTERQRAETLSVEFAEKLTIAGIGARAINVPNKSHAEINGDIGRRGDAATDFIMKFLDAQDPHSG